MILTRHKNKVIVVATLNLLALGDVMAAPTTCNFTSANAVDCQMLNGARWEFNWVSDPKRGMVLNQVTLTAKPGAPRTLVIEQAALAQVLEAYDNNSGNLHHVSDTGLPLIPLTTEDCPLPGKLLQNNGTGSPLLCQVTVPRGYAWRGTGQIQGESLVFFGVSAAGKNTYIHQWVFNDDGAMQPMLGVSGELDPLRDSTGSTTAWPISNPTRYATNRFHTAYWRIDFALAGQGNDLFQQLDYQFNSSNVNVNQIITNITTESNFAISPEAQRFWVLKDKVVSNSSNGEKIAFQIVPKHTSLHRGGDAFTSADVYVTQNKTCEKFASHNPTTSGCSAGLTNFVNGETVTDPVVWVSSTWHQVPRAEDEIDVQTHWQGFIMAPRNLTATSPL